MFKKNLYFSVLISLFLLCFFTGCKEEVNSAFYLDNYWQWDVGADDGTMPDSIITGQGLKKLAIHQEKNLENAFENKKGYVWLRADFILPEELKNQDLGIYVGCIRIAGQVIVNGKTVGVTGIFPEKEFSGGTAVKGYSIPYGFLNQNGKNTVILKIWTNSVGSISSRVYLDQQEKIFLATEWENFFLSQLNLVFSGAMILIAVFYFLMYLGRKGSKEHLMFSLLNFFSAFYLLPFYVSEVPWINSDIFSFLWFEKLFTGIIAHITVWFASAFMRTFLHYKTSKKIIIASIILLIVPCIMILVAPTYASFKLILPISFVFVAFQLGFGIYPMLKAFLEKNRDVYVLLLGFAPVCLMLVVDFVVHVILKNSTQPFFTIMGWQGSIVSFLLILSVRYNKVYKRYEDLTGKLEAEVEQRTLDLMVTNKILKKEQDLAKRDMDMAVYIQKCFYPDVNQQFFGWDIAVYFNPQSGVSGDLYDYYENGDSLEGVSVFDVSGHGIPAGLVTMLSKNIIRREFSRGIKQELDLTKIMENINNAIISGKGSIENYLTGLVVKFEESYQKEVCNCQIVNAGHPHPLLYSVNKNEVKEVYSKDKLSVGMIGIADIEVNFPTYEFSMGNHDVLLLFSDGLIEYKNKNEEDYGKERLAKVLKSEGFTSSKKILAAILADIKEFVGETLQQDDITILVLKRDKDADYIPEL